MSKSLEMANEVNKFFIKKIKDITNILGAQNINDPLSALRKFLPKKTIPAEGLELKDVTEEEMSKVLKQMKNKKSCGLYWICGLSLKTTAEILEPEIRHIVNLTIRNKSYV